MLGKLIGSPLTAQWKREPAHLATYCSDENMWMRCYVRSSNWKRRSWIWNLTLPIPSSVTWSRSTLFIYLCIKWKENFSLWGLSRAKTHLCVPRIVYLYVTCPSMNVTTPSFTPQKTEVWLINHVVTWGLIEILYMLLEKFVLKNTLNFTLHSSYNEHLVNFIPVYHLCLYTSLYRDTIYLCMWMFVCLDVHCLPIKHLKTENMFALEFRKINLMLASHEIQSREKDIAADQALDYSISYTSWINSWNIWNEEYHKL